MSSDKRKIIMYDLDTNKLKKLPGFSGMRGRLKAYDLLTAELKKEGFEKYQKSAYISKKAISLQDAIDVVEKIKAKLPWICLCKREFGITKPTKNHDVSHMLDVTDKERDKILSALEKKAHEDIAAKSGGALSAKEPDGSMPLGGWKSAIAERRPAAPPKTPATPERTRKSKDKDDR